MRRKRDVRIKKEIAACMSHHIPLPRSKLYAFVCLIPCMCMCGCMHVRFCIFTHYQSWLQSFPVLWVRYQSCDLPGGEASAVRNRWGCNIWAVCCGSVCNVAQLCSSRPDHLNQQTQAPAHFSFFHKLVLNPLTASLVRLSSSLPFCDCFIVILHNSFLFVLFPLSVFLFCNWSLGQEGASALRAICSAGHWKVS